MQFCTPAIQKCKAPLIVVGQELITLNAHKTSIKIYEMKEYNLIYIRDQSHALKTVQTKSRVTFGKEKVYVSVSGKGKKKL
jgi:hypothetical protein